MAIIDSNEGGRLVSVTDAYGTYYYLGDDLGDVVAGAWSDEDVAREVFEATTTGGVDAGNLEGDVRIDERGRRVVECAYCHCDVAVGESVPKSSDDDGWQEAAEGHADDCEWVQTRAHSRDVVRESD